MDRSSRRATRAERTATKLCPVCRRPFSNRKKWAARGLWPSIVYCSERCRRQGGTGGTGGDADRTADDGGGGTGDGAKRRPGTGERSSATRPDGTRKR